MTINFWMTDPTILFNKEYILELWPMPNMCYEQKLNAISRIVILITGLGYILTMSQRIMITGMVTLVCIYALFKMHKPKITKQLFVRIFNALVKHLHGLLNIGGNVFVHLHVKCGRRRFSVRFAFYLRQ